MNISVETIDSLTTRFYLEQVFIKSHYGQYPLDNKWELWYTLYVKERGSDMATKTKSIHISDDFSEVDTKTLDERKRISLGKIPIFLRINRVKVYQNSRGEILIRPVVEIPASEAWLFENKQALKAVMRGLKEASEGKVSKLKTKKSNSKD